MPLVAVPQSKAEERAADSGKGADDSDQFSLPLRPPIKGKAESHGPHDEHTK